MDGGFFRVMRFAFQLSMVVLLTSVGALAGVAIHTREARAIDWYDTGLYSYDADSDCPPACVENIKDPITVVFVGAASWQAVREHALQHGPAGHEDSTGDQRYRDNGNCGFEHVDTADAGDNSHRFHLRARQGMLPGEVGPDLDPVWGMYSVGTPHRDQLAGPDDIFPGGCWTTRHYVPENFEGHGYSGFVAGRLFIYQNWVSTDHHRVLHTENWYNVAQIEQCNGERPQSDGIVYYIEVPGDTDGDSLGLGSQPGGFFADLKELFMGTDPYDNCPDNSSDSAWPPDFNNTGKVTTGDLQIFSSHYNNAATYGARYDLNASGGPKITSGDLVIFANYYLMSCP
jgi:hypothetical protein